MTASYPGDHLSVRHRIFYIVVLGGLTTLGPFTIDLYLPSFPALSKDLGVGTGAVQVTLTATTIGFAVGQLLIGPWTDRVGRRIPLVVATAVHIVASLTVAIAPNYAFLIVGRIVQGGGAAAGAVVAMAVVRDLLGGYPLVRMLSRLALVTGIAPIFAPVIGSQLLLLFDWRGIFALLAAYGAVLLVASIIVVPESHTLERRAQLRHIKSRHRYLALARDRTFIGACIISAMNFTTVVTYLASSPFLFQGVYGLTAQGYGFLFGVNSVGVVASIQIGARLIKRLGPEWVLFGGITAQIVFAAAIIALHDGGFLGLLIPLFFMVAAGGLCVPCLQTMAMMNHGERAGTAASVLGACSFGGGGLIAPIVSQFSATTPVPMGCLMLAAVTVSMLTLWTVVRPTRHAWAAS
ncbi:multidrug effflux MFS transporter [Dactylosporangium sp. NPDC048998]|uniref:multidrug effflux MFS transporter n=1 Tax=Dactylosporangium sp. NPDC048998 TaxID=3363976 RepID=UPI003719CFE4